MLGQLLVLSPTQTISAQAISCMASYTTQDISRNYISRVRPILTSVLSMTAEQFLGVQIVRYLFMRTVNSSHLPLLRLRPTRAFLRSPLIILNRSLEAVTYPAVESSKGTDLFCRPVHMRTCRFLMEMSFPSMTQ